MNGAAGGEKLIANMTAPSDQEVKLVPGGHAYSPRDHEVHPAHPGQYKVQNCGVSHGLEQAGL
ncbi:unnamed protein product [Ranitomeya imitator]|uniref:Uncharacterized protein n=1 Tax=Ranitomeya imitator TaxID=111125 RepID=A0ABN9M972_9NEOB|nr:unnamed protein product [Ranitomeya imitator]